MTPAAELDRFKKVVEGILEECRAANATADFAGAEATGMLEHNTRQMALNPLLDALGWTFQDRTEEARISGDKTLYIDYLGINREHRVAELIFEAKAWNASEITGTGAFRGLSGGELVAAAVKYLNGKGSAKAPLTAEWMDRIIQIRTYVLGVHQESGAIVQRAAIGCARWIVIFKNPAKAFLDEEICAEDVLVLDETNLVARSDDVFQLLSVDALRTAPRAPIYPDEIALHINDPAKIRRVFRGVYLTNAETPDLFMPQPSIHISPSLIVERIDGALILIRPRDFLPLSLPASSEFLQGHLAQMLELSDSMLATLNAAYDTAMFVASPIGEFPNFPNEDGQATPVRRSGERSGNFLVATGEEAHYLRRAPEVEECAFHNHEACRQVGLADEVAPVTVRSHPRLSFFVTGEIHHCAHREIQIAKRTIGCPIAVFEQKLCCRTCTLQNWCWSPERLRKAPCGSQRGPAAV